MDNDKRAATGRVATGQSGGAAVELTDLCHHYGERAALDGLSLTVARGEIFGLLGPNGSGKTTLFRVLSTLLPPQRGDARVLGVPLSGQTFEVRRRIGVVFQAPSLDKKLTVAENIHHQAALYGVPKSQWRERTAALLERFRLADRADERTESLSGGLRRRAELAKGIVHQPELLLLDEPSTGLDPGARADLWQCLREFRDGGATIVLTTHLLEEAERCDRLGILDAGRLVALGAPDELRSGLGGDSISLQCERPEELALRIERDFQLSAQVLDQQVRLECEAGHQWVPRLVEAYGAEISSVRLGKPTLEDVFIHYARRRWT
ncbi:MAG: ABC transporter ATP-binding protein [Planctomycetales bacterium]|nr:ABC transporter ATP-binding protein [Planctomycetales bacterium]